MTSFSPSQGQTNFEFKSQSNQISDTTPAYSDCYRFQVPDYQNVDKFRNRVVSNLIYYQTNYAVSSVAIFSLITFMNPFKMILGMSTMVICEGLTKYEVSITPAFLVFGLLYYSVEKQELVREMKRDHPTLVMLVTFLCGHFLIYQVMMTIDKLLQY